MPRPFHSPYSHGFVRAAVCVPSLRVADPAYNAERTVALARRAHELHAAVALFPELGISAYTNDDLFHQDALLDGVVDALSCGRTYRGRRGTSTAASGACPLRGHRALFA